MAAQAAGAVGAQGEGREPMKPHDPPSDPAALEIEPMLTVADISGAWQKSHDTVTRIFVDEPGVLRFGHGTLAEGRKYRRRYFTLRIPLSVFLRVQERLQLPRSSSERRAR